MYRILASQHKQVYFNIDTEGKLLTFANSLSFSTWVKQKIREEIQRSEVDQQVIEKLVEVNQPVIKKTMVWTL